MEVIQCNVNWTGREDIDIECSVKCSTYDMRQKDNKMKDVNVDLLSLALL